MKKALEFILLTVIVNTSLYSQNILSLSANHFKQQDKANCQMHVKHSDICKNSSDKIEICDGEISIISLDEKSTNEKQLDVIKNVFIHDFLVNDDVSSEARQYYPSVSMDENGNFSIAWTDDRNGNSDIFYQCYNNLGTTLGVNNKANDDLGSTYQGNPSIAMNNTGNFVIVWEDRRNGNNDIYFQRFNASGTAVGINTKANEDLGTAWQYIPSIALDANGNFIIVWIDNRNGNYDVYYQRFNNAGIPIGVNTKVNDDENTYQWYPSIALDGSGNFIIVWEDRRNVNRDIYYQRYNIAGTAIGGNTKVNDDATNAHQLSPSISMEQSGNFVIVWEDRRNGNNDIFFQRYISSGTAIGTNTKANDDTGTSWQYIPSIAMDANGNYVIVWEDYRYNNPDIIGQRYFNNGLANGSNYRIVNDGPYQGERLPIIAANNNKIVFSWMDNRRSKGWDIYAKIVGWDWNGVTSVSQENNSPIEFSLSQNYPNPFNPITKIKFTIAHNVTVHQVQSDNQVTLKVYDVLGNEVVTLVDEYKPAGSYEVEFSNVGQTISLSSGVYYYQLKAGDYIATKKMTLLR